MEFYTKLYSGGTPVFEEGNIFRITIPLENVAELQVGPGSKETNKETDKEIPDKIMEIMKETPEISVKDISEILGISVSGVRYHTVETTGAGDIF